MKKTRDGRRRFSREFKIAAVRRVLEGEQLGAVARDLGIAFRVLWECRKRFVERGEDYLYELGRPKLHENQEGQTCLGACNHRIHYPINFLWTTIIQLK